MKISAGLQEGGVVVGNAYDKYGSKNMLVRWIMNGFADRLSSLVTQVGPRTIHEVGCGEGYWVLDWNQQGLQARGSDFSQKVINLARENAQSRNFSPDIFSACSIYDIEPERDSADLIVCCEVLEHLESPEAGLSALQRVVTNYLILSVPREPLWCALNLVRGKYLDSRGNTPGHIQHWSQKEFIKLATRYFDVVDVRAPLPWTMALCRAKR
ncbi:bifunctional 2-polyprenyl-6-hydroxyphenol methylase/3-demethylubiquinol 3-O-methyltransferase UbiG [Desulfobulbus sp.]|uniref:class I SAM-dependent methyltransferase n=1 Tax=Desulfobulbus sp. TaxID=895 RepID=UPI0027B910DF|nr:class I SAM-dependent methyltransferase [Desulfobulbus sp.]